MWFWTYSIGGLSVGVVLGCLFGKLIDITNSLNLILENQQKLDVIIHTLELMK